jgi:hypothetical protein
MLLDMLETPENRVERTGRVSGEFEGCSEWFGRCLASSRIK